jgi:hypothetical protein
MQQKRKMHAPVFGEDGKSLLCRLCDQMIALEFMFKSSRMPTGYANACTRCVNLQRNYGITGREYAELLASQGGVCAACGGPPDTKWGTYCVDHDHTTGAIRGLLCNGCNAGIAQFNESVHRLELAISYLRRVKNVG